MLNQKKIKILFIVMFYLFIANIFYAQENYPYASDKPMPYPEIFQIPNTSIAQSITFSPDGTSFYFVTQDNNGPVVIKSSTYTEGHWSNPKIASFCGQYSVETPFMSPDGSKFFFAQIETTGDIWECDRSEDRWSASRNVGNIINSTFWDVCPSVSANGNLYFTSDRSGKFQIYCSKWINNKYSNPEIISNTINRYNVQEIYIAPDESYILFGIYISTNNPADIYISFKNNNSWTTARSIGSRVNSAGIESRPYVSPDGNYLFFTRDGIKQVDWKPMLDSLRNISLPTEVGNATENYPREFRLDQNYPNPFNPETVICYKLAEYSRVKLMIYDVLRREIVSLVDKEQSAGIHEVKFNGSSLSSGLYLYKITSGDFYETKKMIFLK